MSILKVGPPEFQPELIIFDKDGTLIDFDAMWGAWVIALADRLEAFARQPLREALYEAMGFDAARGRVRAEGRLAVTPMAQLYALTAEVVRAGATDRARADSAVAACWLAPDPVRLARPFTHLPTLFATLRREGVRVAVATTDDRSPTLATLNGLGVIDLVDALVCADDGLAVKPAPDMVVVVCNGLNVPTVRAAVVGDSVADLQMARAAGAGLAVGVLSGVSPAETLAPHADVVIESIAELV